MDHKKHYVICFCLSLVFCLAILSQAKAETLNVTYSNFPPFTGGKLINGHVDDIGLMLEIYNAVLPKLGFSINYLQLPPARIVKLMENGTKVDLYLCGDHSLGKRPFYAFGPAFLSLSINLLQKTTLPVLDNPRTLQDTPILKQQGFSGLKRLLDPSNKFIEVPTKSIAGVLVTRHINYVLGFKDRLEILFTSRKDIPSYRYYKLKEFKAHLCLNKRIPNAQQMVQKIHDAIVTFQDTPDGRSLFEKYEYKGRFGSID